MIRNGDFSEGLRGWSVVDGTAFGDQPISAESISARDVSIDGVPVVPLGGDFWHLPYPIGQVGGNLVRVVGAGPGILDSHLFTISLPYLSFLIGGQSDSAAWFELRIAQVDADQSPAFPALDEPDADRFVAVQRAIPTNSDVMRAFAWPVADLVGMRAKIRLVVGGSVSDRLLVGDIRLVDTPPDRLHQPVWGWADLHCHPMAQGGFGGLMTGHMHGPVEDLGSCLHEHGAGHSSLPFHLVPKVVESHRRGNDGSLSVPGWTTGKAKAGDELAFAGWPAFDDLTHIKVHQDWVKRAYDGGQRLMVALVVHSELLATLQGAPQSDRDTVEPQVQILREFVAHNHQWCGIARTPGEARALIEANKLAFVLGLETDSINGWIDEHEFPADVPGIHAKLHDYFGYLQGLGIVQVNLLHLSDNAFGGMALYDLFFMINSWTRNNKVFPKTVMATLATPTSPGTAAIDDDDINTKVTLESFVMEQWTDLLPRVPLPPGSPAPTFPPPASFPPAGDVNANGLTEVGKEALLEAMRLGMVIDLDHMSELSAINAHDIATKSTPARHYPLVSAHNGARRMAPRPLDPSSSLPSGPGSDQRAAEHLWPNENMKSNVQLGFIKNTGGMFGHGTAASDSRSFGGSVMNDCPGSDKTFAQGYQYVHGQLEVPIGFGTDWNSLLAGPGPRFGTQAASGLVKEVGARDNEPWRAAIRQERLDDVNAQTAGVAYASQTPLVDWQAHRFASSGLYDGLHLDDGEVERMWQAMAVLEANVNLTLALAQTAAHDEVTLETGFQIHVRVRDMVLGIKGQLSTGTPHELAGSVMNDDLRTPPVTTLPTDPEVLTLVLWLRHVRDRWTAMRSGTNAPLTRSMAGPRRDFDYNLDGLAHYGMIPDMLQDLKNVGFPRAEMIALFSSAEQYLQVWQRSVDIGAALPHP